MNFTFIIVFVCHFGQTLNWFMDYLQTIINDPFMLNSVILVFANKQDMVCLCYLFMCFQLHMLPLRLSMWLEIAQQPKLVIGWHCLLNTPRGRQNFYYFSLFKMYWYIFLVKFCINQFIETITIAWY